MSDEVTFSVQVFDLDTERWHSAGTLSLRPFARPRVIGPALEGIGVTEPKGDARLLWSSRTAEVVDSAGNTIVRLTAVD